MTNSYKFLFFLSLLDNIERNLFDARILLSLDEIVLDLLALAWYPHVYFRLSFGAQDQIARELDRAAPRIILTHKSIKPWDKAAIREIIAANVQANNLGRYVPYRLIRPFFPEIRGIKDTEVNMRVAELCEEYFFSKKPPPYRFDNSRSKLLLHPAWSDYFKQNLSVVRGWALWKFLEYMQRCNPNVPAVSMKLFPPAERESLERQTSFWKEILIARQFRCIYSGEPLTSTEFALDHFVPWSFVVHNRQWNLVPTSQSVNSQKSDRLPSLRYLPALISTQYDAIALGRQLMKPKKWEDHVSSFVADLGVPSYDSLLDREILTKAFDGTMLPLLQLAEANGFEPAWDYVHAKL